MIQTYNGAGEYEIHLNSGKSITLTEIEIDEIASENKDVLDRINKLLEENSKYKSLYDREKTKNRDMDISHTNLLVDIKDILTNTDNDISEIIIKLKEKLCQ